MKKTILISAIILGLAALGVAKVKSNPKAPAPASAAVENVLELLPGDLASIGQGSVQQVLQVSGNVRALQQATVKAKVAGEVLKVLVREGESVRAGQLIAQIDTNDARARLEQAQGNLRAASGQLEIANNTRNNNRQLQAKNFISKNALDTAEQQWAIAQANLDAARAALDVAQKAVRDAEVRAPIDGVIASRSVQPGEKVAPDARLLEIVDLRELELELSVPAPDIPALSLGQEVRASFDGLAQPLTARISRISPAASTASRSLNVYAKLAGPGVAQLKTGMFAQAKIVLQKKEGVFKAPLSALYQNQQEQYIWLVRDGRLQRQAVKTGLSGEDESGAVIELQAAPSAPPLLVGATLVGLNLGQLQQGQAIRLRQAKANPASASSAAAKAR
ncbi:efflux RND transporter periplasmic adaptor subunit [Massilia sp. W12]|uniref:efflux RND transporter periplasmic adaptor subunit n=1 Tax=Massilia sp. W12 TaxID=3126507 RepID=UPI0030CED3C1